jgi:hypothetical protein
MATGKKSVMTTSAGWSKEKREEMSRKLKAHWAKVAEAKSSSPSQPLSSSEESSGPPALPDAKRPPEQAQSSSARPSSSSQKTATTAGKKTAVERVKELVRELAKSEEAGEDVPTSKPKKVLAEDPEERDRQLQLGRPLARLPVNAVDGLLELLEVDALSDQEREDGIEAWAALFWFWGLSDPRVQVLFWGGGLLASRGVKAGVNRRRKSKGLQPLPRRESRGGMMRALTAPTSEQGGERPADVVAFPK